MAKYTRLTILEREEISRGLLAGYSLRKISKRLNRSPGSISREIHRSVADITYYRAVFAHQRAVKRRHKLHDSRKLVKNTVLCDMVLSCLSKNWSPEQIAKRLKVLYSDDMDMQVSHETIYSYIYVLPRGELKRELISCLRRSHKHRRRKGSNRRNHGLYKISLASKNGQKKSQTVLFQVTGKVMSLLGAVMRLVSAPLLSVQRE